MYIYLSFSQQYQCSWNKTINSDLHFPTSACCKHSAFVQIKIYGTVRLKKGLCKDCAASLFLDEAPRVLSGSSEAQAGGQAVPSSLMLSSSPSSLFLFNLLFSQYPPQPVLKFFVPLNSVILHRMDFLHFLCNDGYLNLHFLNVHVLPSSLFNVLF